MSDPTQTATGTTTTTADPRATDHRGATCVVFVQTADPVGNRVVAHRRTGDGTLALVTDYPTGGLGGALGGAVADHLGSQGSLVHDEAHRALYAVDAGSDALVVFPAGGDRLGPPAHVASGGTFPVSITRHGDLVYVLNARDGGSIQGFRHGVDGLAPLAGSTRALGLDSSIEPEFLFTPGQIGFSPDGTALVVTTKGHDTILVFAVDAEGRPSATPAVTARPGAVPFSFTFTPSGYLVVAEAGTSSVSSFALGAGGTLTVLDTQPTDQAATCWVTGTGDLLFASNAGSSTISTYRIAADGTLTPQGTTPTSTGTVDAAVSSDGRYLYVQAGGEGKVDEFLIGADGALSHIGTIAVAGAQGGQGIVAV